MLLLMLGVLAVMTGGGVSTLQHTDAMNDVTPLDVFPGIGEYFYIGLLANWTEAYRVCQSGNAHTVIIDSEPEKEAILIMMERYSATSIHLGFHDQFQEGSYGTLLGKPVEATCGAESPWAPGMPQGGPEFNCGGFTAAGFKDTGCDDKQPFICELVTSNPDELYPGYVVVPSFGFFKLYNESDGVTWGEGDATCRDDGGHLVIINSQEQADAMRDAFGLVASFAYWVGVHRYFGGNDNFVTVSGGTLNESSYMTWAITHPFGDFINDPYVQYLEYEQTFGLGTNRVTAVLPFICEIHIA